MPTGRQVGTFLEINADWSAGRHSFNLNADWFLYIICWQINRSHLQFILVSRSALYKYQCRMVHRSALIIYIGRHVGSFKNQWLVGRSIWRIGISFISNRELMWNFYVPGLKGPPGASSNRIVRPPVCLSVCLTVCLSVCPYFRPAYKQSPIL